MDKLILGILMLKKLTVYELRAVIKMNFQAMCSDSLGSIQSAIKRLLDADMVTFSEYVEKSVNKKQYSITDKGRKELAQWLQTPANISGSKNMELGKLLFMGMLTTQQRASLIEGIVKQLEKDLDELLIIQSTISGKSKEQMIEYWNIDLDYFSGIAEKANSIGAFEELTLQYGIDLAKFNIEWFRKLKERNEHV